MGTVLYNFLNESFLFDGKHIADNFSKFTEQELRTELSNYREFCLDNITQLTEEVSPAGEAPSVFSGKSKSDLDSLKTTALYIEKHIIDDPLFEMSHEIDDVRDTISQSLGFSPNSLNKPRISEVLQYLKSLTPMIAADYVKLLPISRIYEPPKELGIRYTENYFSDLLPPQVMDFLHKKQVVRSLRKADEGWEVLDDAKPSRGIIIEFDGHPEDEGAHIFHLQEVVPLRLGDDGKMQVRITLPETPPDTAYFNAWVLQSKNSSAHDFYNKTLTELAIGSQLNAMFYTDSTMKFDLLNFLGAQHPSIQEHTAQSLLNIDLPFLNNIEAESLMRLRIDEGESFQAFRDALERGFRSLRTENDADKLRQKTEDLVHELTEVQVREIDRKVKSLQRTGLAEASTVVLGLAGAVHTAGWSLLAAATAAFQGYKTFEQYRRDVKLNPGYFLWKLKKQSSEV